MHITIRKRFANRGMAAFFVVVLALASLPIAIWTLRFVYGPMLKDGVDGYKADEAAVYPLAVTTACFTVCSAAIAVSVGRHTKIRTVLLTAAMLTQGSTTLYAASTHIGGNRLFAEYNFFSYIFEEGPLMLTWCMLLTYALARLLRENNSSV